MSDTGQVSGQAAVDLAFIAYDQGKKAGVAEVAPPTRRETVWTTSVGDVRISYREPMPAWEVEFLEEFVALWLRGVRRRAEAAEAPTPAESGAQGSERSDEGNLPPDEPPQKKSEGEG